MREVFYKKSVFTIPSEWNELTQKQLLAVMSVLYSEQSDTRGILLLFRALSSVPWWKFYTMRTGGLLDAALEATDFIFAENTLTKNILPKYKGYYGPADELSNMRMGEFCFSEFYFNCYKHQKETTDLNMLVATLYRPKRDFYNEKLNPEGDIRQPFNPNLTSILVKDVKKWPINVKHAILHFYEACRERKIRNNPKVFESGGEESLYGLWSVIRGIAKSGHFGDFDKVQEQYVDTILMELNEVVAEAEKLEAEQKKVHV